MQWDKSLCISVAVNEERQLWQRQQQASRSTTMAENERLKDKIRTLSRENYELQRQLKNERIKHRDEDAGLRRTSRLATAQARLETRSVRRLQVLQSAANQQAVAQVKQLQEVRSLCVAFFLCSVSHFI